MNLQQIILELEKVIHPTINYSLIKLGIIADVRLKENTVLVVFAFPFPKIPIADEIIQSVKHRVRSLSFSFSCKVKTMNEVEKVRFLKFESEGWNG